MKGQLVLLALFAAACGAACTTSVSYVDSASGEITTQPGLALARPIVPNWTVTETPLGKDAYRISLRGQYFRLGGDGEALVIMKQRGLQLQLERGFSGYQLVDYSERIESTTPFNFRIVEGVIQLQK